MDKLAKDAAEARKHGVSYGKWMMLKEQSKKPKKEGKKREVSKV